MSIALCVGLFSLLVLATKDFVTQAVYCPLCRAVFFTNYLCTSEVPFLSLLPSLSGCFLYTTNNNATVNASGLLPSLSGCFLYPVSCRVLCERSRATFCGAKRITHVIHVHSHKIMVTNPLFMPCGAKSYFFLTLL